MQTWLSNENSVCPSVRLVNTWIMTKLKKNLSRFFIPYERSFNLVFWEKEWLVGRPLLPIYTNNYLSIYLSIYLIAKPYLEHIVRLKIYRPVTAVSYSWGFSPILGVAVPMAYFLGHAIMLRVYEAGLGRGYVYKLHAARPIYCLRDVRV